MSVIVFFLGEMRVCIFVQLLATYSFILYLGQVGPFTNRLHGIQEIFNEILGLLSTYILYTFTDWVSDEDIRYSLGWVVIGLIVLNLTNNIIVLVIQAISQVIYKVKVYRYKQKLIQHQKKIEKYILEQERQRILLEQQKRE